MLQMLADGSRRGIVGLVAGLLAFTLLVQPAAGQAGTLDQSQPLGPNTSGAFGGTVTVAQTFTAGVTGSLTQVNLMLQAVAAPGPVTVEIRNVATGGVPNAGPAIGVGTLPATSIPPVTGVGAFISFPLSTPAPVVAGTQYAIVVLNPNPVSLIVYFSPVDVYPGGVAFQTLAAPGGPFMAVPTVDLAFQTFVSTGTLS